VSLEGLQPRAEKFGDDAARAARDRIMTLNDPPQGVQAKAVEGGILLTGKQLRRRFITDSDLRNFVR
jgi:hypothetical protein